MAHKGMKFGIFLAPFHRLGENPTLAMARDMELIEWLDWLGYDEVWVGEHHSAGWELIASSASSMRGRCVTGSMPIMYASDTSAPGPQPSIVRPRVM